MGFEELAVVQAPHMNRSGCNYTFDNWEMECILQEYTKLVAQTVL